MKRIKICPCLCLMLTIISSLQLSYASTFSKGEQQVSQRTIIALAPHIVEMLFDIGAGQQIIATTDFADYPEAAKKIPSIGNYVSLQLERIIALQPDLIIAWKSGNPEADLNRLAKLGFRIIYSQPNSFTDIAKEMRLLGELTGHQQQAERAAKEFLQQLADIKQDYQKKAPLAVFYELWSRPLTTIAQHSWPQQHLEICRLSNPFSKAVSAYPQVNIEQVLTQAIDLIIQPLSINQTAREAFNWQDWPIISAVKNNYIIRPDADAMHRMSKRSLDEVSKLCEQVDQIRQLIQTKNQLTPTLYDEG